MKWTEQNKIPHGHLSQYPSCELQFLVLVIYKINTDMKCVFFNKINTFVSVLRYINRFISIVFFLNIHVYHFFQKLTIIFKLEYYFMEERAYFSCTCRSKNSQNNCTWSNWTIWYIITLFSSMDPACLPFVWF